MNKGCEAAFVPDILRRISKESVAQVDGYGYNIPSPLLEIHFMNEMKKTWI